MADWPGWTQVDIHILRLGSSANLAGTRVGMGFLIGPRHVLTCAHVVSTALGRTDEGTGAKPRAFVTLAFAFSRGHPEPIRATVAHWWPAATQVANRAGLDDVALLELPANLVLPSDVTGALEGMPPQPGMAVQVNGVSTEEQDGVSFEGAVRGPGVGNRLSLRSELDEDGRVGPGYSGAAVLAKAGVIGMMAEKQQTRTGLFIPAALLRQAPEIQAAWTPTPNARPSFWRDVDPAAAHRAGAAGDQDDWNRMSIGARLQRHLHHCDRTDVYQPVADAIAVPLVRRPAICVFGSEDLDLPRRVFDRFQSRFLVDAGIYKAAEVARPPQKWAPEPMTWRTRGQDPAAALTIMKRRLLAGLEGRESAAPAAVRELLRTGCSRAFYSEVDGDRLEPQDLELMRIWSAYCAEIGGENLGRTFVHLLCLKPSSGPPTDRQAFADRVTDLARAGDGDVTFDGGVLPRVPAEDLHRWFEDVAGWVPLDGMQIFNLRRKAARRLLAGDAPRLNQVEAWLNQLRDRDL